MNPCLCSWKIVVESAILYWSFLKLEYAWIISLCKEEKRGAEIKKEDLDAIGIANQPFFMNGDSYQKILSNGYLNLLLDTLKSLLLDLQNLFHSVHKIDDKSADMLNRQHLKMREYYELRRLERISCYRIIEYDLFDQRKASIRL